MNAVAELAAIAARIRARVVEMSHAAGTPHLGSSLSCVDLLVATYWGPLRVDPRRPLDPDRDRFILSKGHAALALYAALHLRGWLSREDLATYCADDTLLGVHPEYGLPGVDCATGSLGQALPAAAGMALAARLQGSDRRVFALLSDAECNEGQVWEAAQFAAHHKLDNLTALVDANGTQALGRTEDVLDLSPMARRWEAFGWQAVEADGHDHGSLLGAIEAPRDGRPRMIIAKTVIGKGVSYMEDRVAWHYKSMNADEFARGLAEVDGGLEEAAA